MTTTAPERSTTPASSGSRFVGELRAEWTKLRSVRSTVWSLVVLAVVTLGFVGLVGGLTMANWDQQAPSDKASIIYDPVSFILGVGLSIGQLAICVLGVLVITSEYSTGMIRSSLLAEPRRWPMLAAKCAVFAVVVFVVGEIVAFASFFLGAAILHSHVPVSLGDDGVLRALVGAGLYLAVLGLFSMAIGAIVRHTAGSITGVIAFILVLTPLTLLIPGKTGDYIHAYLPGPAGQLVVQAHRQSGDLLGPWQGFGVFCLWTALLLGVATFLLQRRDA
jgi:ABC-2 type transport system permease protein